VVSTIQDSLTRQQFSMITSILYKVYESPAASLSSPVSESQSATAHCSHSTVLNCSYSFVRIRRFCIYQWCYKTNLYEF